MLSQSQVNMLPYEFTEIKAIWCKHSPFSWNVSGLHFTQLLKRKCNFSELKRNPDFRVAIADGEMSRNSRNVETVQRTEMKASTPLFPEICRQRKGNDPIEGNHTIKEMIFIVWKT